MLIRKTGGEVRTAGAGERKEGQRHALMHEASFLLVGVGEESIL